MRLFVLTLYHGFFCAISSMLILHIASPSSSPTPRPQQFHRRSKALESNGSSFWFEELSRSCGFVTYRVSVPPKRDCEDIYSLNKGLNRASLGTSDLSFVKSLDCSHYQAGSCTPVLVTGTKSRQKLFFLLSKLIRSLVTNEVSRRTSRLRSIWI